MSGKKRITVSLDEEQANYLRREGTNASQLVNKLVRKHRAGDLTDKRLLEMRKQQLESDLENLKAQQQTKQKELETVKEGLQEHKKQRQRALDKAAEQLRPSQLEPDNLAVQTWADNAGMDIGDFIEEMESRLL